jgi:iron complex outermembrane recepter protein
LSALVVALTYLYLPTVYAEDSEIIVISAAAQRQSWLTSPASVELQLPPAQGIIIDSAQLLNGISGVQADSRANFAQDTRLSVRGFGSRSAFGIRGVYLQQDGIPLSTPDGQGQLSSVLLDNIARVEVLKGPLAALYGNASGGVISLYSQQPAQTGVKASIAGSELHRQNQLQADWVEAEHSLSVTAKQFKSDGYRAHSAAEKKQAQLQFQTTLADRVSISSRFDYGRDPQLQDPLGLTVDDWQQNPRQTATAAALFDTEKTSAQRQFSLSISDAVQVDNWQLAGWVGERNINQRLAFSGAAAASAGGEVVLQRQFHGVNGSYKLLDADDYDIRLGGSLVQSNDDRLGFVNNFGQRGDLRRDQTDSAKSEDLFVRFNWQSAPRWKLQGGWRYSALELAIDDRYIRPGNPDDSGNKHFYNHAVALGLSYLIGDNLSWFISTGTGFESPTLAEVAYSSDGNGVNLALDASTNQQWETGIKWLADNTTGSISLFIIDSKNELLVDNAVGGRTSYRNAAKTQRYGAELQLSWHHSKAWQQQLSAAFLSATFANDALSGKRLPGIANTLLHWQLNYRPWQDNTELSLHSLYRSKVYINDSNSTSAPAALTFAASARHHQQLSELDVDYWLTLDNITDKDYVGSVIVNQSNGRAFEPAPKRQLSVGITAHYHW